MAASNSTQPTVEIIYNDSTIANVFDGQTATLKCEGMKMKSNVAVSVAAHMGVALPEVTTADNGKVLMVVDGVWQAVNPNLVIDSDGVVYIQ